MKKDKKMDKELEKKLKEIIELLKKKKCNCGCYHDYEYIARCKRCGKEVPHTCPNSWTYPCGTGTDTNLYLFNG